MAGFCQTLAAEVAGDGVTVNMILPGKIDTKRVGQLDTARAGREGKTLEEVRTQIAASLPAKRYGQPEEFANVAAFLMSEPAGYVTDNDEAGRCRHDRQYLKRGQRLWAI